MSTSYILSGEKDCSDAYVKQKFEFQYAEISFEFVGEKQFTEVLLRTCSSGYLHARADGTAPPDHGRSTRSACICFSAITYIFVTSPTCSLSVRP